jgi:hypothetical protein
MKIQTFVVVHDQNIILDSLKHKKYEQIDNLNFLFVGSKDTSKIQDRSDVIISKNLEHNVEQYKDFGSTTAWYSIFKNHLYDHDTDYIITLEYDCLLNDLFYEQLKTFLAYKNECKIVGFIPYPVTHQAFLEPTQFTTGLIDGLKEKYSLEVSDILNSTDLEKNIALCTNTVFDVEVFETYMNWVMPLVEYVMELPLCGHFIERSLPVFYLIKNINFAIMLNAVENLALNSMGDQPTPREKFFQFYDFSIGKKKHNFEQNIMFLN